MKRKDPARALRGVSVARYASGLVWRLRSAGEKPQLARSHRYPRRPHPRSLLPALYPSHFSLFIFLSLSFSLADEERNDSFSDISTALDQRAFASWLHACSTCETQGSFVFSRRAFSPASGAKYAPRGFKRCLSLFFSKLHSVMLFFHLYICNLAMIYRSSTGYHVL